MILAGIDEAGYGPLLGPLVVGCAAFEIPDIGAREAHSAPLPCLWKRLRKHVSKTRNRSGRKIHVNDSKLVYSPSIGVKELERAVLALAATSNVAIDRLTDFIREVAAHVADQLGGYPWYQRDDDPSFPLENDVTSLRMFANALRIEMRRVGASCVHLNARVVLERELNRMVAATHNKAAVLFSTAAIHIDHLLRTYARDGLVIFCDRQGGRGHYGNLLRTMFGSDWTLEVTSELDGRSEYKLYACEQVVRIIFCEKAEAQCMSVAVASMLSKYLRESLMTRFNRYWLEHLPGLTPTAGYYNDGERFLRDIAAKRVELGIADADLVRCR